MLINFYAFHIFNFLNISVEAM